MAEAWIYLDPDGGDDGGTAGEVADVLAELGFAPRRVAANGTLRPEGDGNYYVGLNVLVGRMGADEVIELADLADEYGSGEARVTQRQNVILTDVPEESLDELRSEPLLEEYSPDSSVEPEPQAVPAKKGLKLVK